MTSNSVQFLIKNILQNTSTLSYINKPLMHWRWYCGQTNQSRSN